MVKKEYRPFLIGLFSTAIVTMLYSQSMWWYEGEWNEEVKQKESKKQMTMTMPMTMMPTPMTMMMPMPMTITPMPTPKPEKLRYMTPSSMVARSYKDIQYVLESAGLLEVVEAAVANNSWRSAEAAAANNSWRSSAAAAAAADNSSGSAVVATDNCWGSAAAAAADNSSGSAAAEDDNSSGSAAAADRRQGRHNRVAKSAGLLNFNREEEVEEWEELTTEKMMMKKKKKKKKQSSGIIVVFGLEPAMESLQWQDLYPEWIDEEGRYGEQQECPALSMPYALRILHSHSHSHSHSLEHDAAEPETPSLDMVVAKLPCSGSSRDIARLHVQLAAAHVAVSTGASHVLLLDSCSSSSDRHSHRHLPLLNLFNCDKLIAARGPAWLFRADLPSLQTNLDLPVGSCQLAMAMALPKKRDHAYGYGYGERRRQKREAYATILHSAEAYVCGAIAVARSIRLTASTRDLVILVDPNIEPRHRRALKEAGWRVIAVERIRNPMAKRGAYNEWNYSKLRLWQLTMYDKIVFLDADLLVLRNIDFLFQLPQISATGNNASLFNSGVMVIEPSLCTFRLLMNNIHAIVSYNGGDQGFLNEIFPWWHRISKRINYLKYFWIGDSEESRREKTRLFAADPPELFVLHYLGLKPWLCFRDYDCNWNVKYMRKYASDEAHGVWWKLHDTMSPQLQQFCLLSTKQKATLEWHRRKAENASFPDGHWKRKISDPRLNICRQKLCDWKTMLLHWS